MRMVEAFFDECVETARNFAPAQFPTCFVLTCIELLFPFISFSLSLCLHLHQSPITPPTDNLAALMIVCMLAYGVVWQIGNKRSLRKEQERIAALRASGHLKDEKSSTESGALRP